MKKTKENTEHYTWGEKCHGWHMVQTQDLSIIQEIMHPNTREERHYHTYSQQFFFILQGKATFEIEGDIVEINQGEGAHINPRQKHQIQNNQPEALEFLVISNPTTRGDRMEEVVEQ